jgi:hypothetical protein
LFYGHSPSITQGEEKMKRACGRSE